MIRTCLRRRWAVLAAAFLVISGLLPAAAARAATPEPRTPQSVSKIAVTNDGAYVFGFEVQWMDTDFTWHDTTWTSGDYPVGQTETSPELSTIGVPPDALAVAPWGHAVAGKSDRGHSWVRYDPSLPNVATYRATGTTFLGFDISLIS